MTATPNIASVVPAAAASRAALNALPPGIGAMFADLLNTTKQPEEKPSEEPGAAQDSAPAPKTSQDDIDRALAIQLQTLLNQSQQTDTVTAQEAANEPSSAARQTAPDHLPATAAPPLLQDNMVGPATAPGAGPSITSSRQDARQTPAVSKQAGEPAAAPTMARAQLVAALAKLGQHAEPAHAEPAPSVGGLPKTSKSEARQALKTLAGASNAAQSTTTARALAVPAASPDSHGGQQQSGDRQSAGADPNPTAPDAAADLKQPASLQPAAQHPAPHVQPEPQAVAAMPAAGVSPRQIQVTLQVGPQSESAAAAPTFGTLAVNIAAKSKNGEKHFDIRLDPPELGRVEVKLSIDDAGKAQANLAVEKPHTLDLLQKDRATLERALRDAGLDLAGGSLNFSLKGQEREPNAPMARSRSLALSAITQDDSSIPLSRHHPVAADSRLDIRV